MVYIYTSPGTLPPQWHHIDAGGKPIIDFAIALEDYDLIALLTYVWQTDGPFIDVELLCFSNGAPHPLATNSHFRICSIEPDELPDVSSEVVGRNLVISLVYLEDETQGENALHVYDWQRGVAITKPIEVTEIGVVFLTPELFLVPNLADRSIDVYRVPNPDVLLVELEKLPFVTLNFPDLASDTGVLGSQCRVEPSVRLYQHATHPPRARFLFPPADALIIFSIDTENPWGLFDHLFVIRRAALLEFFRKVPPPGPDGCGIPWKVWGPYCARWVDGNTLSADLITMTAGQRMVTISRKAREQPAPIQILDFNIWAVVERRAKGPEETQYASIRLVEGDYDDTFPVANTSTLFAEPVMSNVPYVEITSKETFCYDAVMMNNESIIGATFDDEGRARSLEVLFFG